VANTFRDFSRLHQLTDEQIKNGQIKLKESIQKTASVATTHQNPRPFAGWSVVGSAKAYVSGAYYSNTRYNTYGDGKQGTGEAVNCGNPDLDWK